MKKVFLILPILTFVFCACNKKTSSFTSFISESTNDGPVKVDLDLSNFDRYISYTKVEGYTGVAGWSPYEAWLEFKGLLTIGLYDATVTYMVGSYSYNFKLDVSGGGKTDFFDRNVDCKITKVSGTITYSKPNTKVDLDLSNFDRYISYTKVEGYTGVAGWSPYEAWLEFKGLLTIGLYDATVTYMVGSYSYNFKLDVSGGGKTDFFDRNVDCKITKVSGFVEYSL